MQLVPCPPHAVFSSNASNQNCVIAILFKIVLNQIKKTLGSTKFPRPRRHALKVIPWVYIRFIWKGWSYKLWRGSFDWKLKVLFCFLRVKSYRRGTRLPPLFSPNESDQNIQISIFFKTDQRSHNRNSWVDTTLPEPGCTCKCCTLGNISFYRRGG